MWQALLNYGQIVCSYLLRVYKFDYGQTVYSYLLIVCKLNGILSTGLVQFSIWQSLLWMISEVALKMAPGGTAYSMDTLLLLGWWY